MKSLGENNDYINLWYSFYMNYRWTVSRKYNSICGL